MNYRPNTRKDNDIKKKTAHKIIRIFAQREVRARISSGITYKCPECLQEFSHNLRTIEKIKNIYNQKVSPNDSSEKNPLEVFRPLLSPPRKCPLCKKEIDVRNQAPRTVEEVSDRMRQNTVMYEAKRAASLARRKTRREAKSKE